MNAGKQFEKSFIESVPQEYFKYRFKDGTASWGQSDDNVRFQSYNICDFMIFTNTNLWLLELKSHKGKSVPISCIRDKQIDGLLKASYHVGVRAGLIFNMRDVDLTYYVPIYKIKEFIDAGERKSFPLDWIQKGILIPQKKKKVHFSYDLTTLL